MAWRPPGHSHVRWPVSGRARTRPSGTGLGQAGGLSRALEGVASEFDSTSGHANAKPDWSPTVRRATKDRLAPKNDDCSATRPECVTVTLARLLVCACASGGPSLAGRLPTHRFSTPPHPSSCLALLRRTEKGAATWATLDREPTLHHLANPSVTQPFHLGASRRILRA